VEKEKKWKEKEKKKKEKIPCISYHANPSQTISYFFIIIERERTITQSVIYEVTKHQRKDPSSIKWIHYN
jgi:hypothetical protein